MFYSQTFLARKGPLGTVWRAAHQQRVKKSQYTSTHIPSTVDRIMFPEVPIALRLSAFLLLGVVRIYSKKVYYLSEDCNAVLAWLRKAFASIELTLPEDARQAPIQSITLPETFDLDALDLDDGTRPEGVQDNHLRRSEDITLADQIPSGRDPYVAISFDEDIMMDSTIPNEIPDLGVRPMDAENLANPTDVTGFQSSGPTNRSEFNRISVDKSPQSFPEIESLRDAPPETSLDNLDLFSLASNNNMTEPLRPQEQTTSHKDMLSPIVEDNHTLRMPRRSLRLTPASLREDPSMLGLSPHQSVLQLGVSPPALALRSTPPNQQEKVRPRKRKQFFDESTVLNNKFMRNVFEDWSDLVRERRNIPGSSLGRWKSTNISKKEQILLLQSLHTGLCSDLCNIFDEDYILAKCCLIQLVQDNNEELILPEIERLRHIVDNTESMTLPDLFPSFIPSPRRDDPNPMWSRNFGSPIVPLMEASTSARGFSNFDGPALSGNLDFDFEKTNLPSISELINTTEPEDLYFLEADNSPTGIGSQAGQRVESLSVRTRAVARYLKSLSPIKSISEDTARDLNLNKILERKTRKQCARMFYEILVLKSYSLVHVHQDEPYADISLQPTPMLSKAQI